MTFLFFCLSTLVGITFSEGPITRMISQDSGPAGCHQPKSALQYHSGTLSSTFLYPLPTKLKGGILVSACPSVRLSVRPLSLRYTCGVNGGYSPYLWGFWSLVGSTPEVKHHLCVSYVFMGCNNKFWNSPHKFYGQKKAVH